MLLSMDVAFDDPKLIADAGLVPMAALAERLGVKARHTPLWPGGHGGDPARRNPALDPQHRPDPRPLPATDAPHQNEDEVRRAIVSLGETVEQVLDETGLSEEELAHLFDLKRQRDQ